MTDFGLTRSRSLAIVDSVSVFPHPLSKTYSVPCFNQFSEDYSRFHGLRSRRTVRPRAHPNYRSYFRHRPFSASLLRSLPWNDKALFYNDAHNAPLRPRHFCDYHAKSPFFMNHSFTFYPNKYTFNWLWYGNKLPSYYRNLYYVSPYYDYYCNNAYNLAYNYR
ncbi:hypothetical protein niasHS_003644 [Heterodera schachtii]|uniref:Uncharacterized protein n=1 Tax=Heterodera schachtii TaxID=97005 RepID=A0ABD2KHV4_HETSC